MNYNSKTINILGSKWTIKYKDHCLDEADGYTDTSIRTIAIEKLKPDPESKQDLEAYTKQIIRHELIHAFLYESGLESNTSECTAWAKNEEMVDWLAIQSPKIFQAFKELDLL